MDVWNRKVEPGHHLRPGRPRESARRGQLDAQAINAPGDGPRALGLEAASQVWFRNGGALYHLGS
ncbi:hypothetical protein [Deinococcus rubellus]|uniref:Uncharacterized protein n=1 Tax=Deinococcus rubellus TaxID=1889240 RepID=A0ABY5YJA2_9DEIO|nr:hypothetical protein [Deinococcus rubellus]UWX64432.1 hypothetical protein N0D28_01820 [Deinococcus rubellus]